MTAVTIRPTFKKDSRPSNGLEEISDQIVADKARLHFVVGVVKWAGATVSEDGDLTPAVKFLAIEPLTGEEAGAASAILDRARKGRQLGKFEDEHPTTVSLFDFDGDGHPTISAEAETRLGPDGEREVPEPDGDEIVAELDERRAKKAKEAEADTAAGVPAATFSGGTE